MGVTLTPVLTSPPVYRLVKGTHVKDPKGHFGRAYRAWFSSSFLSKSQMYSEDRMTIESIQAYVASRIVNLHARYKSMKQISACATTLDTVNAGAVCMAEEPKEHPHVHIKYVYVHSCKLVISLAALVAFMCYHIFLSLPPPSTSYTALACANMLAAAKTSGTTYLRTELSKTIEDPDSLILQVSVAMPSSSATS